MGNLTDYLKDRCHVPFDQRPFCEADNLVLSELAYLDLNGIVPAVEEMRDIGMLEAARLYYDQGRTITCGDGPGEDYFGLIALSCRFQNARLHSFREKFDRQTGTDFCALHIDLDDGTTYIAFRGTSNSLVGWREDFSMSFQLMPSQILAAEYLKETVASSGTYRVGGHSKGGNLAVYAAMMLPSCRQKQIMEIYSNDGPGLCPDIIDLKSYPEISDKIIRIVPEFSVIGALFENEPPTKVVRSSSSGLHQHDGMSWMIEGEAFCTVPARNTEAEYTNHLIDHWIESATMEQRQSFTDDLFDALEAGGATKRTDIGTNGFEEFETLLLSVIRSQKDTKVAMGKFFRVLAGTFQSEQFSRLLKQKKKIQGMGLFFLGLLLAAMPEFAIQCTGTCVVFFGMGWFGKQQLDWINARKSPEMQEKVVFNLLMMCVLAFLAGQQSLLLRFTNVLMGVVFLTLSYRWAKNGMAKKQPRLKVLHLIPAALAFVMGVVPIIATGLVLWQYVMSAGLFIMLLGVGRILQDMTEKSR